MDADQKIKNLFIDIPEPHDAGENTTHLSKFGKLIFVAGQLPWSEGRLSHVGRVGLEVSLDNAKLAARLATTHTLGILLNELGRLSKIKQILNLDVTIASGGEFKDHTKIANASASLLVDIFGKAGIAPHHVTGVLSLPFGAPVQVGLLVEIK